MIEERPARGGRQPRATPSWSSPFSPVHPSGPSSACTVRPGPKRCAP